MENTEAETQENPLPCSSVTGARKPKYTARGSLDGAEVGHIHNYYYDCD